jgi:hypothetical protein
LRWLGVSAVVVLVWSLLFWTVVLDSSRVWARDAVPIAPLPIGPSYLSLFDIARVVALTAWLPTGVLLLVWGWRRPARLRALATPLLIVFMLLTGCWASLCLGLIEYTHEDTVYAPGFSMHAWNQVRLGMPEVDVFRLLGPPLPIELQPRFATDDGAMYWVRNWSAGHSAAVWFERQRVTRVEMWYSD